MALTVDDIVRLASLVSRERLDTLEYDGLLLTKSIHDPLPTPASKSSDDDDDDEDYS